MSPDWLDSISEVARRRGITRITTADGAIIEFGPPAPEAKEPVEQPRKRVNLADTALRIVNEEGKSAK